MVIHKKRTPYTIENHEEVIDLGAPRCTHHTRTRTPRPYTPNPRLYPDPKAQSDVKKRISPSQGHRSKRKFTRPVPNSRLYRPQPAVRHSLPPPASPRISWPPPTLTPRPEDTASNAALHVLRARNSTQYPSANRLVVKLPVSSVAMEAANRHSTSPECSDGNDASSAPSEFLAEFLSAIMRRQYAEALKYCRLILQYEPHNTTARGFYPLLQHKLLLNQHKADEASTSEDSPRRMSPFAVRDVKQEEVMQQEGDSPRSSSCSSLELDSSDAPRSSRSASPSRRTDPSDRSDRTDHTEQTYSTSSHWDSGGERSDRDDNGNSAPAPVAANACGEFATSDAVDEADVNDNATPPRYLAPHLKSGSSLQQLRAQFACSIK